MKTTTIITVITTAMIGVATTGRGDIDMAVVGGRIRRD